MVDIGNGLRFDGYILFTLHLVSYHKCQIGYLDIIDINIFT